MFHTDLSKYIVFAHSANLPVLRTDLRRDGLRLADYVARVRIALKRYISHKYSRGTGTLEVFLLDSAVEERLGQPEALTAEESAELLKGVREEVGRVSPTSQNPVILTTLEVRSRLRKAIYHEFPGLVVVNYQELSADMNIKPLARISPDLEPYDDESFYRFIDALPVYSDSRPDTLTRSGFTRQNQEHSLFESLEKHNQLILRMLTEEIRREHRHEFSESALTDLLERFLDGYAELLITGQTAALHRLFHDLAQTFATKGTKISYVFDIPLRIAMLMRRLLAEEFADPDQARTIHALNRALDQTEAAAHRAALLLLPIGLQSKFGRAFQ
jgi:hypothetical protein